MANQFNFEATKQLLNDSGTYYIICTDNEGNYSYINNRYAKSFSHIHHDFVGQPYYITMHPEDTKVCEEVGGKCYQYPGQLFPATIRKKNGSGGYVITQWEFTLMTENDVPKGIFCLGYDITEYEQIKNRFFIVNQDLEDKKEILGAIAYEQSHVVRAPLANVLGLITMLKNFDLEPEAAAILNLLQESSQKLDDIVKSIVNKTS